MLLEQLLNSLHLSTNTREAQQCSDVTINHLDINISLSLRSDQSVGRCRRFPARIAFKMQREV
jgi:hypothetical protein